MPNYQYHATRGRRRFQSLPLSLTSSFTPVLSTPPPGILFPRTWCMVQPPRKAAFQKLCGSRAPTEKRKFTLGSSIRFKLAARKMGLELELVRVLPPWRRLFLGCPSFAFWDEGKRNLRQILKLRLEKARRNQLKLCLTTDTTQPERGDGSKVSLFLP